MIRSSFKQNSSFMAMVSIVFLLVFISGISAAFAAQGIRNGAFDDLEHWNISPDITQSWDPIIESGGISLDPPDTLVYDSYTGTVIYQNLNITSVNGKSLDLSMDLYKEGGYVSGKVNSVALTYVTSEGDKILEIDLPMADVISTDPENPTHVSETITMPTDAQRIVKLSFVKESWGELIADNVSLIGEVEVGPIPRIDTLSKEEGPYGTVIEISGANFGTAPELSLVSIGGQDAGVTVDSWGDTSITVTVDDPARSGLVYVVSDYVESDIGPSFDVTSPHYTVDLVNAESTVVKGQVAEFVIRANFCNGFETAQGITFSIEDGTLPQGAEVSFKPVPLKNPGGSMMLVNTENLNPGGYSMILKAEEEGLEPRYGAVRLEVVTIDTISFYDKQDGNVISEFSNTTQGIILGDLDIEVVDNQGNEWEFFSAAGFGGNCPYTVESSNPSVLRVVNTNWGPEYYALTSGTADIVVTASDGTEARLPVTTTLSDPQITEIWVTPGTVSYDYEEDFQFSAASTHAITGVGYSVDGLIEFSSTFLDDNTFSSDNKYANDTFKFGGYDPYSGIYREQKPGIFTVCMYASTTGATGWTFLDIVPSSSRGELKGGVRKLEPQFGEYYILEFYDSQEQLVLSREIWMIHHINFHLGDIPPGTYRLKLTPEYAAESTQGQWYPNGSNFAEAEPITFTAGETVDNVYFFIKIPVPEPNVTYMSTASGTMLELQMTGDTSSLTKVVVNGPEGSNINNFELNKDEGEFWSVFPSDNSFITSGFPSNYSGTYTFVTTDYNDETDEMTFDFQPGTPLSIPEAVSLDSSGTTLSWNDVSGAAGYYLIIYSGEDNTTSYREIYNGDEYSPLSATTADLYDLMTRLNAEPGDYSVRVIAVDRYDGNEACSEPVAFDYALEGTVPGFTQAITVSKMLAGLSVDSNDLYNVRDVNLDGKIGFDEFVYILQSNAGLVDPLPAVYTRSGTSAILTKDTVFHEDFDFSSQSVVEMDDGDFYMESGSIEVTSGVMIKDLGAKSIDSVKRIPSSPSDYLDDIPGEIQADHVYAFKLADGTHALIQFTKPADDLDSGVYRYTFQYKWQPDGSTNF